MIYIDPPYNTGNDFIYEDDFSETPSDFLKRSNQVDASGNRLVINAESNGRFHSDWLSMLYPRLKLARNFLRDDGVIFVSIDDVEFPNLRKILDEVFGESNFLATLVWDRNRKNDAKYFSVGHEYMVVYAKNEPLLSENQIIFRGEKDGVEDVRSEFDRLKAIHGSDWAAVRQGLLEFYRSIPDDDSRAPLKRFTKVDGKGPYRAGLPQLPICRWPPKNDVHDQALAAPLFTSRCFV
jgi:adenine-specific DNA-methyltransferase